MIDKPDNGGIRLACDECEDVQDDTFSDFHEMLEYARDDGWKIKKVGGYWEHYCPDCEAAA